MSKSAKFDASPPKAESLIKRVKEAAPKGPPPVHLWNPPFSGDLDMQIKRDGTWFYEGTPIKRPELVRLFASILKLEDGQYFLVTPVEKVGLTVEDAPFIAIDFDVRDDALHFETNVGDRVIANTDHQIRVEEDEVTGEPSPYIHIRRGLEALIDRKSFYRLADIGEIDGDKFVVRSAGQTFVIGPAA